MAQIESVSRRLSDAEHLYLSELGLSKQEQKVYELLVQEDDPLEAKTVAAEIGVYPNAVYRIFTQLEYFGLAVKVAKRPVSYRATERTEGYVSGYSQKRGLLEEALHKTGYGQGGRGGSVIIGRQALYDAYITLASEAKSEIAVFAVGIAYSAKLHSVQQAAIERGVHIRHVVQRISASNYHILHKWKSIGVNIRQLPEEQGFHLTVIDRTTALVTFSDPNNTEDRLTLQTNHPAAVTMFQTQFEDIWARSQETTVK